MVTWRDWEHRRAGRFWREEGRKEENFSHTKKSDTTKFITWQTLVCEVRVKLKEALSSVAPSVSGDSKPGHEKGARKHQKEHWKLNGSLRIMYRNMGNVWRRDANDIMCCDWWKDVVSSLISLLALSSWSLSSPWIIIINFSSGRVQMVTSSWHNSLPSFWGSREHAVPTKIQSLNKNCVGMGV